jgi:hypothetical protein
MICNEKRERSASVSLLNLAWLAKESKHELTSLIRHTWEPKAIRGSEVIFEAPSAPTKLKPLEAQEASSESR